MTLPVVVVDDTRLVEVLEGVEARVEGVKRSLEEVDQRSKRMQRGGIGIGG